MDAVTVPEAVARVGVVARKVPAIYVVDESVAVVVDPVARDLTGVGPHVGGQVRMRAIDPRVDDGHLVPLRQRVLFLRKRLLASVAVADERRVVGDLERDDGDVVLPAAAVRRLHQRRERAVDVVAVALDHLEDRILRDHVREAVGTEQEKVTVLGADAERVDVHVGIGAERARDH